MDKFRLLKIHHDSPPPVNDASKPPVNDSTRPHSSPPADERAPKVLNINDNGVVHERIFLAHGKAGNQDGNLVVQHHVNSFPSQRFPITKGHFKALIHLEPGPNNVRLFVEGPQGARWPNSSIVIHYVPLLQNPPLHLVLLLGKDSKGTFDSPKYKRDREGNDLELAKKKLRMAGYMMSAFTDEQMYRNGFGHRTFRLYEEWGPDTLSNRDRSARTTAVVHVLRTDKTVAEIRDPNRAQQKSDATDKGALFGIALDTIRNAGGVFNNGHEVMVAALFLDAHWDANQKLIQGHAALGGGAGHIKLAIFGSQAIHSWPSCLEEVVPSLMDDTRTDTSEVANDSNQSGTSWECLNIGMGAFMHEIGHLLGCPHQESGVMLRDYITWNRSFMTRDGNYCARTNGPGKELTLAQDECNWHRLDVLRFRYHPAFRLPQEYPAPLDPTKPNLYPVEGGAFARSATGIYLVEIRVDDGVRSWLEYHDLPQTELFLIEQELRDRLPEKYRSPDKKIKIELLACGEQQTAVEDFGALTRGAMVQLPSGGHAFKSNKLGSANGDEQMVVFPHRGPHPVPIARIQVHSGNAVDGVEFFFEDGSNYLFGKRGGSPHDINFRPGEQLIGFYCRTGAWVDGLSVITSLQRTNIFGKAQGGKGHDLVPPHGYRIAGLYGNIAQWTMSIGILYTS